MAQSQKVPEDGYQLVATSVEQSISEILLPFKLTAISIAKDKRPFNEHVFFDIFLKTASSFTQSLCELLAKGLRTTTQLPEIKGTPTSTLAPRIRQEVFAKLDAVLAQYIQVVNVLGVRYTETSSTSAALTGAVVGKILGGNQSRGDTYAVIGGLLGAAQAKAEKKTIEQQARLAAFYAIQSYLKELEHLPESLLDFGVALVYGSNVDFNTQARTLQSIENGVLPRIRKCSDLVTFFTQAKTTAARHQEIDGDKGLIRFLLIGLSAFIIILLIGGVDIVPTFLVGVLCLSAILFYRYRTMRAQPANEESSSIREQILKISDGI